MVNPEALEDPDYSDEDAPPPDEIAADESEPNQIDGKRSRKLLTTKTDLLDEEDPDTEVVVLSDTARAPATKIDTALDRKSKHNTRVFTPYQLFTSNDSNTYDG